MKVTPKFKTIGFALALSACTFACNRETTSDVNEEINEAQVEGSNAAVETNRNYEEFEAWVQDNSSRAETTTKEEWTEIRAEYRRREAELEAESANWDEKTRREWEELKSGWNKTENKVKDRLGEIDDVDIDVDINRKNN